MKNGKSGAKKFLGYKHPVIFGVILTMVAPILIIVISKITLLKGVNCLNSDWLGFWGSYFGAAISVLVAIWVVKFETEETNEVQSEVVRNQLETTRLIEKMISEQSKLYYSNEMLNMEKHVDIFKSFIDWLKMMGDDAMKANKSSQKSVNPLILKMVDDVMMRESAFVEMLMNSCPSESYKYVKAYLNELRKIDSFILKIKENEYSIASEVRGYHDEDEVDLKYYGNEILEEIPELTIAFNVLYKSMIGNDLVDI